MFLIRKSLFTSLLIIVLVLPLNVMATTTIPTVPADGDPPSGENVQSEEQIIEIEAQTPASVTGETMQGNGTVVDYTTSGSKAFYTIVDTDQNTFYLIIDMDKTSNNVYFLKSITQTDLEGTNTNSEVVEAPVTPVVNEVPQETTEESDSGLGFTLIVLLLAVGGVAAYYFLVMRKRHQNNKNEDLIEDEEEMYDDESYFDDEDDNKEVSR